MYTSVRVGIYVCMCVPHWCAFYAHKAGTNQSPLHSVTRLDSGQIFTRLPIVLQESICFGWRYIWLVMKYNASVLYLRTVLLQGHAFLSISDISHPFAQIFTHTSSA